MSEPQEPGTEQLDRLPDGKIPAPARYVEYDGQVIVRERYSTHQRWKNAGSHDGKRGDPPTILGSRYCRDEDEVLKPKNDHLDVNEIEVYYVADNESVVYEVAEEEPEIVTDGGLRTPTHCPHCGYEGAVDGHGPFTRSYHSARFEGGVVETSEKWDTFRCPDCGERFALLDKTVRQEFDGDGNRVQEEPEIVTDGGQPASGKEHSGALEHFAEEFVERCPEVTLQEQMLVLQEETGELSEEVLKEADGKLFKDNSDPSIEEEVGDVIFTAITVGLMAGVDPLQAAEDTALENSVRLDEVGR